MIRRAYFASAAEIRYGATCISCPTVVGATILAWHALEFLREEALNWRDLSYLRPFMGCGSMERRSCHQLSTNRPHLRRA